MDVTSASENVALPVDSSPVLVAPGMRTGERRRWGAWLAFAAVVGQPRLWLLGTVAFCLRGGVLILLLPIIALPTQVEVRLIIGDYLGSTGFTTDFWMLLAAAAALAAVALVGVLLALARIELSSFELLLAEVGLARPAADRANGRMWRLFLIRALALVALVACAAPVVLATVQAAYDEISRPSSSAPILERVLAQLGEPLLLLIVAIIAIDTVAALVSRHVLVRGMTGRGERSTPAALLRTVGVVVVGWAATIALLVTAIVGLSLAWSAVRGAFLTAVSFGNLRDDLAMVFAALGLSSLFVIVLGAAGFVSAWRAALWSLNRLGRPDR